MRRDTQHHIHIRKKKMSMADTQVPFDKLKLASAEFFFAILKRREWEVGTTITTGVLQQLRSGVQGKFAAPTGIGKPDPVSAAFSHACYFSIRDSLRVTFCSQKRSHVWTAFPSLLHMFLESRTKRRWILQLHVQKERTFPHK